MEPYYESWENSSHSDVDCIECHYEPGAVETFGGKFKALSQLAKYITRTEGTKPWAEVSDQSCMRSGCHAVPMLEGPIAFGDVAFDHRHHLLESRRGRRLRCTSCHSQIVQGEHVSVTASVCYMCHFMPDEHGARPEDTSDCLMCHGPPSEPVMVAGRPFDHTEYAARGVSCIECHEVVLKGDGEVRRERCHSCHAEVAHIERFGETAFLHEMHVTDHKVECFECHDEIQHGLLPLEPLAATSSEGCGACHFDPHDANQLLYAGTGAVGIPDRPSRMYETRVVCASCHTGRKGFLTDGGLVTSERAAHPHGGGSGIAAAGSVDCIHCHGTGFAGMLENWQGVVQGELERLQPLVADLGEELEAHEEHPARELYEEAWRNVSLVEKDGSRGAHNPLYALDALRAGAERLEAAYALLEPPREVRASGGLPFVSADGCSECHLGIERADPITVRERPFSHGNHVQDADLDCRSCHDVAEHGAPAFPRDDCGSCHHQEGGRHDPWECASCHKKQEDFVYGEVGDFEPLAGPMEVKECDVCHGEPPDIIQPSARQCSLCHDDEYDEALPAWRETTTRLLLELEAALAKAEESGASPEAVERARRARQEVMADGSDGVHNFPLTERLLKDALEALR